MAKKMTKGLIGLSSAAVIAVYAVGYAVTEPAAVSMAAGLAPDSSIAPAAAVDPGSAAAANSPVATATTASQPATQPTAGLKDGSYKGTGWSRRGSVDVSVTIKSGKIVAAPITGVTTHYAESVIAGLPAEVVARQSSQVDLVSGATDSSTAYQEAVAQALSQAGGSAAPAAQTAPTDAPSSQTGQQTDSPSAPAAGPGSVQVTGPNGVIYQHRGHRNYGGGDSFSR